MEECISLDKRKKRMSDAIDRLNSRDDIEKLSDSVYRIKDVSDGFCEAVHLIVDTEKLTVSLQPIRYIDKGKNPEDIQPYYKLIFTEEGLRSTHRYVACDSVTALVDCDNWSRCMRTTSEVIILTCNRDKDSGLITFECNSSFNSVDITGRGEYKSRLFHVYQHDDHIHVRFDDSTISDYKYQTLDELPIEDKVMHIMYEVVGVNVPSWFSLRRFIRLNVKR
jgi:hypothetical protein